MDTSRREFLSMAAFFGIQANPLARFIYGSNQNPGLPEVEQNPYLQSIFEPISTETRIDDLAVVGEIPSEITGAYFRNGPNPPHPTDPHHWFDGDGMIHRIGIRGGKANYCSRYVRTQAWELESKYGKIFPGLLEAKQIQFSTRVGTTALLLNSMAKDTSNTDLIYFRDQIISLWWLSGVPYALDPETLEAQGIAKFEGYQGHVAAHARIDPRTGDLFFLDFGQVLPWVKVVSVNRDGQLNWSRRFTLPSPRIYHDILFTENYVVLLDFPVGCQYRYPVEISLNRNYPARVILVPRDGNFANQRIFETDPCYVLHGLNAFEQNGQVKISVSKFYDDPFRRPTQEEEELIPYVGPLRVETRPVLWTLDLSRFTNPGGKIREEELDSTNTEFPRINDDFLGTRSRFSYHPRLLPSKTVHFNGLIKYDWDSGRKLVLDLPANKYGEEFIFIPRRTRKSEDDGWLASIIHDLKAGTNSFEIYDAFSLDPNPVASIQIPQRIPAGFHAKWVPSGA
jgi:carotenoid cleavage dioxygenase